MIIDSYHEKFLALATEIEDNVAAILTEQDARFQIIDRLLEHALGWSPNDFRMEPHSASGYTDYLLSIEGAPAFVVEAKRTSKILIDTADKRQAVYGVNSPALKSSKAGFDQAAGYCRDYGVDLAALTTGDVWITFLTWRGVGRPYHEGKAIVFPNLRSIRDNFAMFFDLFSKEGVTKRLYRTHFARAEGITALNFEPLASVNRPGDGRLLAKTGLALDLEPIFKGFFGDLTGDADRQMMIDCFVETRESRTADTALEKMIGAISANITAISTDTGQQIAERIEAAVETGKGENVLIVGSDGAGKSLFLERFFSDVLDRPTRDKCLVVRIDLSSSPGDAANAASEITEMARSLLESQLFASGYPKYDDLQGMYFSEYQRWSEGAYQPLYNSNKEAFKIKFGEFLEKSINSEPFLYILHLMQDAVKNRKLLPCFIFDNVDQHSSQFQEAVFQWSQALRKQVPFSLAILPIKDRTIWRLSKAGPFQANASRVFYLPVPSTKDVLERRISYLKGKAIPAKRTQNYFLTKGIYLSLESIHAFAACMEEMFVREDFISRRIGWLTNHDIRKGLELSAKVITSPYLSIDELVAAYLKRTGNVVVSVKHRKFMQALISGDYNQFADDRHGFVVNVFENSEDFPSTPLLHLSLLKLLIDKGGEQSSNNSAGYIAIEQVETYFSAMAVSDDALREAVSRALEHRLIEPFDPNDETLSEGQRVAITHAGRMHYELATTDAVYVGQMAFATRIRSASVVDKIRTVKSGSMGSAEWAAVRRTFVVNALAQDRIFARVPSDPMFDGQRQLRHDLLGNWGGSGRSASAGVRATSPSVPAVVVGETRDRVKTVLKHFDTAKGFGFLTDCEGGGDIFIHARLFRERGDENLPLGSIIVCDVAPGKGGKPQAVAVHSVELVASTADISRGAVAAIVKFYRSDKGYGFVNIPGSDEDIYLSANTVSESPFTKLAIGEHVSVVVGPPVFGRGRAVLYLGDPAISQNPEMQH